MGKRAKRSKAPRRPARRVAAAPATTGAGPDDGSVRINLPGQELLRLPVAGDSVLRSQAMRWNYALRNRERWNTQPGVAGRQRRDMIEVAHELGLTPEHFERIAQARLVEVDVPWADERTNWECRIFPWEFLLASVTRDLRGGQPLTAVRRLRVSSAVTRGEPESWLQVLSAPGAIAMEYDFTSECDLLDLCVHSLGGTIRLVKNPDETTLAREVESFSPSVIHLTGVDSHQGWSIIDPDHAGEVLDGYFMRSRDRQPHVLEAEPLARLLTSGQARKPMLISCKPVEVRC